ncbi:MAG: hypothetical protein ACRCX2_04290 [Paraclostridium sp.]
MNLLSLKGMNIKDIKELLKYHLELKDIKPYCEILVKHDKIELDFDELVEGFEGFFKPLRKYFNVRELFRDFEEFVFCEDSLFSLAEDKYIEELSNTNEYYPGDIWQSDFV